MAMTRRVIVGFDGSRAAFAAVDKAIAMTREQGPWEVLLVCAHDRPPDFSGNLLETARQRAQDARWLEEWRSAVDADMKQAKLRIELAGADAVPVCTREYPPDLMLRVANEFEAEAIIVPDDRSGPFLDLIFGSLARQLLREADVPVLVVQSDEPAWLRR
jgi:nucleotide-binding universal stress UspA family protein